MALLNGYAKDLSRKQWCFTCPSDNQNDHLQFKVHSLTLHVITFPHLSLKTHDSVEIRIHYHTKQFSFRVFIFIALLVLFMNAQECLGLPEISTELSLFFHPGVCGKRAL